MDAEQEIEALSTRSRKFNALFALIGISVVSSLATWVFAGSELGYGVSLLAAAVANIVAILSWVGADAEERQFEIRLGLRIFIILLAIVAVPYYFFKTRGFSEGIKASARALLFWISMYMVGVVTLSNLSLVEDRLGILKQATLN